MIDIILRLVVRVCIEPCSSSLNYRNNYYSAIVLIPFHIGSRYWMYCLLFLLRGLDVIESRIDTVISGLQSVWMDGSLVPANSQTGIIPGYFY